MNPKDGIRTRRFKHIFLDAEGTLYIPKNGRSRWEFWADPTPDQAIEFFELDDGVPEALEKLRNGAETLCLVSRNTAPILYAVLDHFGIRDYFDSVILNGDKGRNIARFLEQRGLSKDEAVMVGDMPAIDLYPVLRAGVYSLLVDRDYNRTAKAERIKGVRELPTWLNLAEIAEDMVRNKVRIATLDEFGDGRPRSTKSLMAAAGV